MSTTNRFISPSHGETVNGNTLSALGEPLPGPSFGSRNDVTKLVSDTSPLFIGVEAGTWVLAPSEIGLERVFLGGNSIDILGMKLGTKLGTI